MGLRRPASGEIEIIAHRGFSASAPENTIAAIEAALRAGARAVEWDVHVAACGTAMVIHDDELDRTTTGSGRLDAHTSAQLSEFDAGSWFSPEFAGERIPTLREAFTAVRGRVDRSYPEIKGYRDAKDLVRMVALARDLDMIDSTTFISMDYDALRAVRAEDPTLGVGYVIEKRDRWETALEHASADAHAILNLDFRIALSHPELLDEAHALSLPVAVWTVDAPSQAEGLRRLGVSGFTTNQVATLLDWSGFDTT